MTGTSVRTRLVWHNVVVVSISMTLASFITRIIVRSGLAGVPENMNVIVVLASSLLRRVC